MNEEFEVNINAAVEILNEIRDLETQINALCDEIHKLEETRNSLTTLNSNLAAAKYSLDCEQSTYDRLTQDLTEFTKNCKHTLNPSVIIDQLGKKWAIVEQQKESKKALKEAKLRYNHLASDIKNINDNYGDLAETIEQKKLEYQDLVSIYNAHLASFIPYTKITPILVNPSLITRIKPFAIPQDIIDESERI